MSVQQTLPRYLRAVADGHDAGDRRGSEGRRAASLRAWASFVEALPVDDEALVMLERAQAPAAAADEFVPVCDSGLFIRTYGLADHPPPDPGTWREFLALEGDDGRPPVEASTT